MTDAELSEAVKIAWAQSCDAERKGYHPDIQSGALEHLEALREAQRQRAQDHGVSALEAQLKESRESEAELFTQLEEAKGAATRADKTAEGRHRACEALELVVDQQRKKLRKQEQTIQTQSNTIVRQDDMIERMRVRVQEADRCNENQRQLIQTLREQSATALIQTLRDDVEEARVHGRTEWTRDDLLNVFDTYERRLGE